MAFDFSGTVLKANMSVFGEPVLYKPQNAPSFLFCGIFDSAYTELVVIDGNAATVTMPVLGVRLCDMAVMPRQSDQLEARGLNYIVREVRKDSHGGAKLMLNEVSGLVEDV